VPGVGIVHSTSNCWPREVDVPGVMVVYDLTFLTHPQFHTIENVELCKRGFERAVESGCLFSAISHNTRDDLIALYGVEPSRVFVAYPGVDPVEFHRCTDQRIREVRAKYRLPDRFFLYVGSLEPRKNLRTLIEAISMADTAETLVVVGASGWRNAELHELIDEHGDRVVLLGYVSQMDLAGLYSAATATVYPSLYEGFGYPVVESMACGTPVVTSANSSLREIGCDAALLIAEPGDPRQIAGALEEVAANAGLRDEMSRKGLERAAAYTPQACARAVLDVYRRLLPCDGASQHA
jgi:alpha-1,3-rhamnosyl/mannosyltransferase